MPTALLKALKHACTDRDIEQQDAIVEAIQVWLSRRPEIPDAEPEDVPVVVAFPDFLRYAEPGLSSFMREMVHAWLRHEETQKKRGKPSSIRRGQ